VCTSSQLAAEGAVLKRGEEGVESHERGPTVRSKVIDRRQRTHELLLLCHRRDTNGNRPYVLLIDAGLVGLPGQVTIVGIILVSTAVNLLIGSASAKWALLAPIFVPMLMQVGLAPELTQAAYRVGDSSTNIITPLMPYFPLVVVFCQRYVKHAGIGTLASLMLPYSLTFLVTWTLYLLTYWAIGLPLGVQSAYTHP
jgi:hypothetical protein